MGRPVHQGFLLSPRISATTASHAARTCHVSGLLQSKVDASSIALSTFTLAFLCSNPHRGGNNLILARAIGPTKRKDGSYF
jgi:hypothetical protein